MKAISAKYYNAGSSSDALSKLKTYIQNSISAATDRTYIIAVDASTHITAIGEKHNSAYCSFLVFGYLQSATHLKMVEGTWTEKSLE